MTTFADPSFTATYQGLCNKLADTLNRQDLVSAIPDFTVLATARINRDMARVKHPYMINRAQATAVQNYIPLPNDFVSVYQLIDQDTTLVIDYISPDQSKDVMSKGWGNVTSPYPQTTPYAPTGTSPIYYTLLGNRIRLIPAPGQTAPEYLDLWYYARILALNTSNPTNWALVRYPDLYLYGSLVHSAPYLKADDRLQVWEGAYQTILADITVEADRAVRSQTKLVAARKSF